MRRKFRFGKFLLWGGVLLVVLLVVFAVVLDIAGERVLRPVAEDVLEQMMGTGVEFDSLDFDLAGRLELEGLRFGGGDEEYAGLELGRAEQVDVVFAGGLWGSFKGVAKSIEIDGLAVNVVRGEGGEWNFAGLDLGSGKGGTGGLENLTISDARLRVAEVVDGELNDFARLEVGRSDIRRSGQGKYVFSVLLGEAGRAGTAGGKWDAKSRTIEVSCDQLGGSGDVWLGNYVDVRDLDLELGYDESGVKVERLTGKFGEASFELAGTFERADAGASYEFAVQAQSLLLSETNRAGAFVYGEGLAEELGGGLEKIFYKYKPEGEVDLDVDLKGEWGGKPRVSGVMQCKDIAATYYKFPYRIENLFGSIMFDDEGIRYPQLKCRHGDVELDISGFIRLEEEGARFETRIRSPNMRLDEDLYKALKQEHKQLWFSYAPSGKVAIDQKVWGLVEGERHRRLEVELLGVDAVYQNFPYPLKDLRGRMVIEDKHIRVEELVSERQVSEGTVERIRITGETAENGVGVAAKVEAENVPVSDSLLGAFDERQREFYEQFEPEGLVDAGIEVIPAKAKGERPSYHANVNFKDGKLGLGSFGMELSEVEIAAIASREQVIVEKLTGRSGQSQVELSGRFAAVDATAESFEFEIGVSGLDLGGKWLTQMPEAMIETVSDLGAKGTVDVKADVKSGSAGEEVDYIARVTCGGVSVEPSGWNFAADNIRGDVVVVPDEVLLDGVEGSFGKEGTFRLAGKLSGGEQGRKGEMQVTMKSGRISELPWRLLGEKAAERFEDFEHAGAVDLMVEDLRFGQDEDGKRWFDFEGRVEPVWFSCRVGDSPLKFDGVISAEGRYEEGAGLVGADGDVVGQQLIIKGRRFEDVRGSISFDAAESTFASDDLKANSYGGEVSGAGSLKFADGGVEYAARLTFEGIGASDFVRGEYPQNAAEEGFRGIMSGSLGASGKFKDGKHERMGRLKVDVADMRLARQSFFGKVLMALQFNKPRNYIFDRVTIDSYFRDDVMVFEQVLMIGKANVFRGRGSLALDTQRVDLDFTAFGTDATEDPSMMESLARGLGGAVARVDVRGELKDPQIETQTFPVLKGPFQIFGIPDGTSGS